MPGNEGTAQFEAAISEKIETMIWTDIGLVTDQGIGAGHMVLEDEDHRPELELHLETAGLIGDTDILVLPYDTDPKMWEALTMGPQTAQVLLMRANSKGHIEAAVLKGTDDVDPKLRDEGSGTILDRTEVMTIMNSDTFDQYAFFIVEGEHFEVKEIAETSPTLT